MWCLDTGPNVSDKNIIAACQFLKLNHRVIVPETENPTLVITGSTDPGYNTTTSSNTDSNTHEEIVKL